MPSRRWLIVAAAALGCGIAQAQPTPADVPDAAAPAQAQPSPPTSADAQPTLPAPVAGGLPTASPIVGGGRGTQPLTVRKRTAAHHRAPRHRLAHVAGYGAGSDDLDRPALAGVELVTPIPHPIQPPHHTVPVPGYPLDNFITFYTTPPPPVICQHVPRDPDAPDPHLVRERTVVCAADNP